MRCMHFLYPRLLDYFESNWETIINYQYFLLIKIHNKQFSFAFVLIKAEFFSKTTTGWGKKTTPIYFHNQVDNFLSKVYHYSKLINIIFNVKIRNWVKLLNIWLNGLGVAYSLSWFGVACSISWSSRIAENLRK